MEEEECDLMRVITPWCCICRLRSTCAVVKVQLTESLPERYLGGRVCFLDPVLCTIKLGDYKKSSSSFDNSRVSLCQETSFSELISDRTVYQRVSRSAKSR